MSTLNTLFDKLSKHIAGEKGTGVNFAGSIYQITVGTASVIIGRDTLRLTYSDNKKNTIISFTPCQVSVGTYSRDIELNLSCFESNLNETYGRLHVDGGELFQYTTLHDFDFGILPELFTKYLELLKQMKESPLVKGEKLNIDEAIENITAAVELYNKEA